ncbi:carbon-monoxide dehydrogenase medium subunit [Halogranum amylolyticum]|uniref:Carbon-monoxide dehydrogenase medium subunit n=1 Tax=Halogranum amylolyticum TaxID=660520 RepID=A0A1H8V023_9EURY|nr:FAD binding domain-containing protein [Halogranum amylolyticum]SEP08776.1 carbon-monoxide dehydrogenase medium subunit [Halogranum amylolyticum]
MYPSSFEYHAPTDVQEAVDLLVEHGDRDVELIAGGHSLLPTMKSGLSKPEVVVDIADIDQLHGVDHGEESSRVGAMTTYATVAADETLARSTVISEAAAEIGDVQVRNVGTVGGNVAHADPAADLPAAVLVSDATVRLQGPSGDRSVPAAEFFQAMFTTDIREDELLTGIDLSHLGENDAGAYVKKPSPSSGYALVGVAVVLETDGETIMDARIGANGAFDHAMRLKPVEETLTGEALDGGIAHRAAGHATDDVEPYLLMEDDTASSDFRAHLLEVYTERAIDTAIERVGSMTDTEAD